MTKKLIAFLTDFDMTTSGYKRIATQLSTELVKMGYEVLVLGLNYRGEEIDYPFGVHPIHYLEQYHEILGLMLDDGVEVAAALVGFDIVQHEALMETLEVPNNYFPYIGLFPLEAPPLKQSWTLPLFKMDARLVMSRFGQQALADAGVASTFIPIGVESEKWRPPAPEEKAMIREGLGIPEDTLMILTVADNQERKNLSRAAEIIADISVEVLERNQAGFAVKTKSLRDTTWRLVTRPSSPVGWDFNDLGLRLGIKDRIVTYNRGIPDNLLWSLYAAADIFLLTSKAEGLAVPMLEAMSCGLPVVATHCTAMAEHIYGEEAFRGWGINTDYQYIDPFGNGIRYWASREAGVLMLGMLADEFEKSRLDCEAIRDVTVAAKAYVDGRTYEAAAQIAAAEIEAAIDRFSETRKVDAALTAPPTLPPGFLGEDATPEGSELG